MLIAGAAGTELESEVLKIAVLIHKLAAHAVLWFNGAASRD